MFTTTVCYVATNLKNLSEDVSIWKEQPNLHSYLEEKFQSLNKDYMED
jgi:hypothetical protein